MAEDRVAALLQRIDTEALRRTDAPTVALVVINDAAAEFTGVVRFHASFPIRAEKGAQPVTVRDSSGQVVPSRLSESRITISENLPEGRVLWSLTLEFFAYQVPPKGWRAYGAVYEANAESLSEDENFWDVAITAIPAQPPVVYETDCHAGDLPLHGFLTEAFY